jgi:hypothetical protein
METNSIRKRGFPIWKYPSLPAHFRMVITIWKWWSPYWKHSHMVIFPSVPKWKQTLFGNGLVTEPSPFGNGDPFQYRDPHIEMGIHSIWFPIWKWGLTKRPHFHMGMCLSPFPYGNHYMETGSHVIGIHMETGIPPFHMGMWLSPFPYGDCHMENSAISLLVRP